MTVGRLIALLLVPVVLLGAGLLFATADASCDDADALRTAELYEKAADRYAEILGDEPSSECGKSGMAATIEGLCDRANRLRIANHADAAGKVYEVALALEPAPETWTCSEGEAPTSGDGPVEIVVKTKGIRGPRGKRGPRGRQGKNCCTG